MKLHAWHAAMSEGRSALSAAPAYGFLNRGRQLLGMVLGLALLLPIAAAAQPPGKHQARSKHQKSALDQARRRLVEELRTAGITDPRVLQAIYDTPRHEFVPPGQRKQAWLDMALPIGEAQTISPPFVVAYMTQVLEPQPEDRVLEIGTGSGYQAAVLSPLVKEVYTIEIVESLGQRAARTLKRLKYDNVFTRIGDGYLGWEEHAPFDKIIVTCSPEHVPQPLVDQLREGGLMVIPLGERYQQTLYLFRKHEGKLEQTALRPTLFVPMTGAAESERQVKPDPERPALVNGGFEELAESLEDEPAERLPRGWHYLRQAELVQDPRAPQGERYLRFFNTTSGLGSQALQAFAVDGRKVKALELSLSVKWQNVQPSPDGELPVAMIMFYDDRRASVGEAGLGPWRGSFDWREERKEIPVPPKAREAILRLGLFGATGEIWFDNLNLRPVPRTE